MCVSGHTCISKQYMLAVPGNMYSTATTITQSGNLHGTALQIPAGQPCYPIASGQTENMWSICLYVHSRVPSAILVGAIFLASRASRCHLVTQTLKKHPSGHPIFLIGNFLKRHSQAYNQITSPQHNSHGIVYGHNTLLHWVNTCLLL